MEKKRLQIIISTLLIATTALSAQGYKIGVNAPDFAGKQIIIIYSGSVPRASFDPALSEAADLRG